MSVHATSDPQGVVIAIDAPREAVLRLLEERASLDAHYSLGPAQLVGTTLTLALDPFDDKPNPEIGLKTSLNLPAAAGIKLVILGGLELEAGLARVGGNLLASGGLDIRAQAGADFEAQYKQGHLEVRTVAYIQGGLLLLLALHASVYGELGFWRFKKRWTKSWKLYDRTIDTGVKFKIKAPLTYSTTTGVKLPSSSEIEVVKPQLSAGDIVSALGKEARQEEKES